MSDDDSSYLRWLTDCVAEILQAAVNSNGDRVADLIQETGERYGHQGVFALCCGMAKSIQVLGRLKPGGAQRVYGLEVHQADRGVIAPEEIGDAKAAVVMRFLEASLNDDIAAQEALFAADPVRTAAGLANLLGTVGRSAEANHKTRVVARKRPRRDRNRP